MHTWWSLTFAMSIHRIGPCTTESFKDTNALFMAFPIVHDVCYVKGR